MRTLSALYNDEAGFIVSAEMVLIGTIAVLALVVGLSEVAHAVNSELNDIGEAFGSMNQSFTTAGFSAFKKGCRHGVSFAGSSFRDSRDDCDGNECDITCAGPVPEAPKHSHY